MANGTFRALIEQYQAKMATGDLSDEERRMLAFQSLIYLLELGDRLRGHAARIDHMEDVMNHLTHEISEAVSGAVKAALEGQAEAEKEERTLRFDRATKLYLALVAGLFALVQVIVGVLLG